MHQLSGQYSSLVGVRLEECDISLPEHLGIYADDDSCCPPAILLLPLLWSVYSPPMSAWLWSYCGLLSFSHHSLTVPVFVQKTSGSQLSQKEILQTLSSLLAAFQQRLMITKSWINYFNFKNVLSLLEKYNAFDNLYCTNLYWPLSCYTAWKLANSIVTSTGYN